MVLEIQKLQDEINSVEHALENWGSDHWGWTADDCLKWLVQAELLRQKDRLAKLVRDEPATVVRD